MLFLRSLKVSSIFQILFSIQMQWFPQLCLPVCWSVPLYHLNLLLIPSSVFLFQLLYLQLYLAPYIFSLLNFSLFVSGGSNLGSVLKNTFYVCLSLSTVKKKNEPKISTSLYTELKYLFSGSLCFETISSFSSPQGLFCYFSDYKDGISIEDLAPYVPTPLYAAPWLGSPLAAKHKREKKKVGNIPCAFCFESIPQKINFQSPWIVFFLSDILVVISRKYGYSWLT